MKIILLSVFLLLSVSYASAYEITIDTDKESYTGGDTVEVSGTIDGGVQGDLVALEIKNTQGDIMLIRTVELGPGGSFSLDFKLPKSQSSGNLEIIANAEIEDEEIEETKIVSQNSETQSTSQGGGCLIATATFQTELAPQVQLLREVRDNILLGTTSGTSFMTGFNHVYYTFSPTVADWERENSMFREIVRTFITPMISTLSIMTLVEEGSEIQVLGLGISVIALNMAIYIAGPTVVVWQIKKRI